MALTFDKGANATRLNRRAVFYALATGICIASYTVTDGLGARRAGSALGFAVWLTIGDGVLTFLIALLWKKREMWRVEIGRASCRDRVCQYVSICVVA